MKKIFILILFLLPLISAIDLDLKSEFNKGETLLATFSGNFLESVSESNIVFYRGHVKIPIDFELMNVGNDYYVYALLKDKDVNNYSIALENTKYYKQGEITDEAISKNFTITETFADFSINPGFVSTTKDFEITIQNLQDTEITININSETIIQNESESEGQGFLDGLFGNLFLGLTGKVIFNLGESNSITLSPNEIKKITFELGEIPEPILDTISFSTANTIYEFPVYVPSSVEKEKDYSVSLNFKPSELKISLYPNLTKEETIVLENVGDKILENITLELSNNLEPYVNISKTNVYNLGVNASVEILLLFSPVEIEQIIEGELTARIPNETEDLSITFEMLIEDVEEIEETKEGTSATSKNCSELNGTIFEEPKKCTGETRFAKDGNCCIGELEMPIVNNTGLIIGWAIIMTILIALVWFFRFKYKAGKEEIDLFKISRGKEK